MKPEILEDQLSSCAARPEDEEILPGQAGHLDTPPASVAIQHDGSLGDAIVDVTSALVVVLDPQGRILRFNRASQAVTGYGEEEVVGRAFDFLFPPDQVTAVRAAWSACLREGESGTHEHYCIDKTGDRHLIVWSATAIRRSDGSVDCVVASGSDITEYRRAQDALRQSEARYRALFENLPDAAFLTLPDGRVVAANPAACAMFEATEEEIVRGGREALIDPEDPRYEDAFRERTRTGRIANRELTFVRKSGEKFAAETSSVIIPDATQTAFVILRDITERERAEEALRVSEERFAKAFATNPAAIAITGLDDGTIVDINETCEAMFGYRRKELIGRAVPNSLWQSPEDRALLRAALTAEGSFRGCEQTLLRRSGEPFVAIASAEIMTVAGKKLVLSTWLDITERKRAEDALRAKTQQLESLLTSAPLGVTFFDASHRFVQVNEELAAINGVPAKSHLGRTIEDLLPSIAPTVAPMIDRVFKSGQAIGNVELTGDTPREPGVPRHWLAGFYPVRCERGEVILVGAWVAEITAMRRAQEALQAGKEQFALALKAAQAGSFDWDAKADIAVWSEELLALYGLTRHEFGGRYADWLTCVLPEDRAEAEAALARALTSGVLEAEFRITRQDTGALRWINARGEVYFDEERRPARLTGINVDITARKRAEEALRESEERFRVMADGLPLIVWVHDAQGRQQFVNATFCEYFGVTREEMQARRWQMLTHPADLKGYADEFMACVRERRPFYGQTRVRRGDGAWRWLESWARPRFSASGEFLGHVGTSVDITERKQAEESLRDADRRKDEFLATLAHELRNPLAPLVSGLEIIKRVGGAEERTQRAGAMMERQLHHLVRLVDDLLDLSRISTGKLRLRRDRIELGEVLRAAVEATEHLFGAFGHELHAAYPTLSLPVEGDFTRLTQVVSNLLTNAAKYTELGGHIWLSADRQTEWAVVRVRDSGLGIPADKLDSIFEMFSQLHHSGGASAEGLGIGLHLARRIAQMHGGTIEARSAGPRQGSEFIVRLPLVGQDASQQEKRTQVQPVRPLRILVVDDNSDATESLAMLLGLMGHEVRTAADGFAALALVESFRPEVMLLDLGMPGIDGYETARRIRTHEWGASIFLSALSGWGQDEDRHRSREAGFDHHLLKPVNETALAELFARVATCGPRVRI